MDTVAAVQEEIKAACARYGAEAKAPPVVIAVSKTHGAEKILPLLTAGHRVFGENRVQEAQTKWPELKAQFGDVELHLIGPLQTNKVKEAVALFDVIETLDRPNLADALEKAYKKAGEGTAFPELYIQVNTGEEEQKAGIAPGEADAFIEECITRGLPVTGLMCIPPLEDEPAPHFALLREIAARHGLPHLSMGMSKDYGIAAALGATHVRIGTALFGPREGA